MPKYDVVVIGAGISGLTAAYKLQKSGKKILVLEKENTPGGRMSSIDYNGTPIDLGARFVTPFYKNIIALSKEVGIEPKLLQTGKIAIVRNKTFYPIDPNSKLSMLKYAGISTNAKLRLVWAHLKRLNLLRKTDIYDMQSLAKYENKTSYEELREECGFELMEYFIDPLYNSLFLYDSRSFSVGMHFAEIKKYFNFKLMSYENGIGGLATKLAEQLEVSYNHKVTKIERGNNEVSITVETPDEELKLTAQKVVIALPGNHVLDKMLNPHAYEANFFTKVKYSSTAVVFFHSQIKLPMDITTIWYPYSENATVASIGLNIMDKDKLLYSADLRDNIASMYGDDFWLNNEIAKELLITNSEFFKDMEVVRVHMWKSALPKFMPGQIARIIEFKKQMQNNKTIFFCGDYLHNPNTEGAVTSGLEAAELIEKQWLEDIV